MEPQIIVVEYDPRWPSLFEAESQLLANSLAPLIVAIEHIGSTAVSGLAAKPIIDIMLGVKHLAELERRIPEITRLGYVYVPEFEAMIPERRFFHRACSDIRTHHLHAVEVSTDFWIQQIAFRNYLRGNQAAATEYAGLKKQLALRFGNDRKRYTTAKTDFITMALRKAHQQSGA